jgi:hypothetical protein
MGSTTDRVRRTNLLSASRIRSGQNNECPETKNGPKAHSRKGRVHLHARPLPTTNPKKTPVTGSSGHQHPFTVSNFPKPHYVNNQLKAKQGKRRWASPASTVARKAPIHSQTDPLSATQSTRFKTVGTERPD